MSTVISGTNGILLPNGGDSLVWYEEGSWTPAISAATPGTLSVAYTSRSGQYTRVGRQVTCSFNITISSITVGTSTGQALITGLPFASGYEMRSMIGTSGVDNAGTWAGVAASAGSTQLGLEGYTDNGAWSNTAIGALAANDVPHR